MAPEVDGSGAIDWGDDEAGGGVGLNTWPDPSNVLEGVTWYQNNVLVTGTLKRTTITTGVKLVGQSLSAVLKETS